MKILICGAGQVGYGIAERLAVEKNDVTVIDSSPELIATIRDTLDVRGFVGHGAHPDVLSAAGADEAEMIIAVTLHDEVNMVACQVAHSIFNTPTKIARIRAQSYRQGQWQNLFAREHMPIDEIISPEIEVGNMVLNRMAMPGAVESISFFEDKVSVLGIQCQENCPVVDTPLKQLTDLFPGLGAIVVGVVRNHQLFVPKSSDSLLEGDLAYVVCSRDQVNRTLGLFGHEEPEASRVVIAGGGNIGLFVATELERLQAVASVKVVEMSRTRSVEIADELERTVILNGSALDLEILREADVHDTDTMIALTNDDEVNILSGVMAKKLGSKSNMALINNSIYHPFANAMGIDTYINPRSVTISKILQHVRIGRIRGVHSLHNGTAEVIESEALGTSPLVGTPLREFDMPAGVRFGAILRKNEVIMPDGDVTIQEFDRVILFVLADQVKEVQKMFRASLYYTT